MRTKPSIVLLAAPKGGLIKLYPTFMKDLLYLPWDKSLGQLLLHPLRCPYVCVLWAVVKSWVLADGYNVLFSWAAKGTAWEVARKRCLIGQRFGRNWMESIANITEVPTLQLPIINLANSGEMPWKLWHLRHQHP